MHLSNTLRVIPINVMCIVSLGFVYTARVQINEELICTIPLNLLRAGMGDGCGNEAESADEPGSRFGTLEITSRKGGKLQRPVKPEKQGADVSRKTGSHDGPERGWPREPRGSLPGSAVLSVIGDARGLKGYLSRLLDERQWFNLRLLLLCGDGDTK